MDRASPASTSGGAHEGQGRSAVGEITVRRATVKDCGWIARVMAATGFITYEGLEDAPRCGLERFRTAEPRPELL